jgi:DNA-binding HxlR family transcriptional regulator
MVRTPACDNHCPVFYAISRFGDKWSLLIVRDLMFFGKRTYGEFLGSGEGIATNILANRLAQLESDGIIDKRPDPDNGARILYSLTEKGMALMPVLLELINWSATYDDQTRAPPVFVQALREDRESLQKTLRELYESDISLLEHLGSNF